MNVFFLDTETTGIEADDRLVQVCVAHGGSIESEYFKAAKEMGVKAMSVTHITNKMLADKPPFIGSTLHTKLTQLLSSGAVLVAHNAPFDVQMLQREGIQVPQFICTLRVARHLDTHGVIPEYNLQFLRYYLDLEIEAMAHDATGDVKVLIGVFERLFAKMKDIEGGEEAALAAMIEISARPSLFKKFNFGKYLGKSLEEVAGTDRGYLEWLLKQKKENNSEDVDWIYTLTHYLQK